MSGHEIDRVLTWASQLQLLAELVGAEAPELRTTLERLVEADRLLAGGAEDARATVAAVARRAALPPGAELVIEPPPDGAQPTVLLVAENTRAAIVLTRGPREAVGRDIHPRAAVLLGAALIAWGRDRLAEPTPVPPAHLRH